MAHVEAYFFELKSDKKINVKILKKIKKIVDKVICGWYNKTRSEQKRNKQRKYIEK